MLDIGFSELLLIMIIGLVVLGPERLPVAVRTVAGWIRTLRSLAATVQNELSQELKLQELEESLKKVEKAGLQNLTPELKASMDELKNATEALKRCHQPHISANEFHSTQHSQIVESKTLYDKENSNELLSTKCSDDITATHDMADQHDTMNRIVVKTPIINELNSESASHSEPNPMHTNFNSPHGDR